MSSKNVWIEPMINKNSLIMWNFWYNLIQERHWIPFAVFVFVYLKKKNDFCLYFYFLLFHFKEPLKLISHKLMTLNSHQLQQWIKFKRRASTLIIAWIGLIFVCIHRAFVVRLSKGSEHSQAYTYLRLVDTQRIHINTIYYNV